jgi:hypothetical protein
MNARLLRLAVIASVALFFWSAFLPGWTRQTTDFPNYYTAARLVGHGTPLRLNYDWTWFQRQMDRAGIDGQLGGYIPQTPLTMLPVVPMSSMKPQNAKRLWLIFNLLFLALTIELLSRITGFRRVWLWLLIFACWEPLRNNFVLGQYYVFLLFLFTSAVYALARGYDTSSGAVAGMVLGLKLYGAPLLIWFAARRRWRAVMGMAASTAACIALALALFGWSDVAYFTTQVLPRALQGETLNPYHPGNGTFSTLLRVSFMEEPELNPQPLVQSPAAFFFLQPLLTLTVLAIPLLSAPSVAWFLIALLLASPNTASYTFVLLALPVALLLSHASQRRWHWLLVPYIAIGLPMPATWIWAFPRLWLLCALYIAAGYGHWKSIRPRNALAVLAALILAATASMAMRVRSYRDEPGRTSAAVVSAPDSVYSAFPVASLRGFVYQSIANGRYLLRRRNAAGIETFAFDGEASGPSIPDSGSPIYFELAAGGFSRIAAFNPASRHIEMPALGVPDPREPAISHDGKLLAVVSGDSLFLVDGSSIRRLPTSAPVADPSFVPGDRAIVFSVARPQGSEIHIFDLDTNRRQPIYSASGLIARPSVSRDKTHVLFASTATGPWQIWIADFGTGHAARLTGGNCNNSTPAWGDTPDQVLFASDCGRGLGLSAVYRIDHLAGALAKHFDPKTTSPLTPAGGR